jgi:hypothetical protein
VVRGAGGAGQAAEAQPRIIATTGISLFTDSILSNGCSLPVLESISADQGKWNRFKLRKTESSRSKSYGTVIYRREPGSRIERIRLRSG